LNHWMIRPHGTTKPSIEGSRWQSQSLKVAKGLLAVFSFSELDTRVGNP
jgi:hypothetical protein